jgi:hypothetical protein
MSDVFDVLRTVTSASRAKPISTRGAIEEMPQGCVAVADAMGITSVGGAITRRVGSGC